MSGDPFANTTTVKNILQHIISPKLVSDGSGGYVSKTDVVNVHNLVFSGGAANEDGSSTHPFTTQCGTITGNTTSTATTVYHSRVTTSSVIFAVIMGGGTLNIRNVVASAPGMFVITCSGNLPANTKLGWFIAKF
jgi:hypothetical protein